MSLVALLLIALATPAQAQSVPPPAQFTAQVAQAINAAQSDLQVRVTAPLTLQGRLPTGMEATLSLEGIYTACQADPGRCPSLTQQFVARVATMRQQAQAAPARDGLRLAIRPEAYVRRVGQQLGRFPPSLSRSLPPGLVALVYMDSSTSMRLIGDGDLQPLGLTSDEAVAIALKNTSKELDPIEQVLPPLQPGEAAFHRGSAYESSRLLYVADWSSLAAQSGGRLYVAAPSAEQLIWANGSDPSILKPMADAVRAEFEEAERPLSASVFMWQANGWVTVAP